ncbi:MAG: EF-hand domain-containing protein [Hyphococcus sp.]
MTPRSILLFAAFGLAATAANAQNVDFASLDLDVSGGLSLAEAQAIAPDLSADDFARFDSDGSGELSEEEFANWVSSMQTQ